MKFIELVKKRRSTRKYLCRPVSRELIDLCIEAARMAPSASNSQPWSFLIVDNHEKKEEIVKEALSGIYAFNRFVSSAPVIIVVFTEKSKWITRLGARIRGISYNLIDIGIACDHLTLQAAELGLGTCWLGWFNEKAVKKVLNLASSCHIDVMISLGFPDPEEPAKKSRKSLDTIRKYY